MGTPLLFNQGVQLVAGTGVRSALAVLHIDALSITAKYYPRSDMSTEK